MEEAGQKRKFPYYTEVPGFEVKQSRPEHHPGQERNDPRVFQQPAYSFDEPTSSTDFTKWTPDEIKSFLDRRGGDYDDCNTFEQLVRKPKGGAAAGGGGGYDSDEEVYATAKALESGTGGGDDDDDEGGGRGRGVEALAPLDHGSMLYAPFAKDFYDEAPEIAALSDAEGGHAHR
ncbi:hypothetical protein GPECTOR_8g110 [Gonium pectorale]|uniref:Uncharacterized protein n=1 Tax=Gonium pectorale TaxID=33097 RepID=A0A150GS85_GONPE|nr:hypothetical protein GPECTOR_8g110 [Gonium pectorale]|eukprot:KXZ52716.1 hypothetical protein GPECTOR_8g110 [Gonium pectorale]